MINTIERQECENYISYIKRITELCSNKTISYSEWADCLLGDQNCYGEENCRKGFYIVRKMLDKLDENVEISEDDIREELEELRDTIYKERVKLQDAQRCKNNLLREEARFENLVDVLRTEIKNIPEIQLKEYDGFENTKEKYAVLCLSDWHCGALVDSQFNFYNIDTMIERANDIKNKALKYCELHEVTNLIVEINGDMIDGLIRVSSRVEQEEDAVAQIVTVSNVLSELINELKPFFKEIKVYTSLGNHSRIMGNKQDCITKENFEMLIPVFLRERLKDIKIIDSHGLDFLQYNIGDKIICLAHGQNDKLNSVISDFTKVYKVVPDEVHLGHTHGYKDINDCDIIVNVNGSLIGSNDYSLTLRKVNAPSQNLIVYEDDRCVYELKV